ncbi:lariat debranching enzyme [Mactra antiquata]
MKIAVEGCCHGALDEIYQTLEYLEKKNDVKVDLLLICGDFQAVRNMADMQCMAVPLKHREMNSFYKYYSGEAVAPVLTIFIGGNHEASNYLQELPYGGWVAPKIYYLGYAGVVQFGGVRIGGMSGIYKGKDFMKGHFEHPPYSEDTKRSAYHIRTFDVFRLKQLKQHVDIFLSHDWPRGIYKYGNVKKLVQRKKFLAEEIDKDILGNPVAADLLAQLQPTYWFSAHLHVKFPAIVQHSADLNSKLTKFLALDKCLPGRQFLQVVDIPHDSSKPMKLQLDPEWLAILKSTNHLLSISKATHYPGPLPGQRSTFTPTEQEIEGIKLDFGGDLTIPETFTQTVPVYDPNLSKQQNELPVPQTEINEQTTLLCSMLDLTDPNAVFLGKDSTLKLPEDQSEENADDDAVDDNDDVDDDEDSEPSFVSLSGSDISDTSYSLLSGGNDSVLSTGNDSFVSLGAADELLLNEENKEIENTSSLKTGVNNSGKKLNEVQSPAMVHPGLGAKRLSLSEKLKNCPPNDLSGSNSEAESSFTALNDDDDGELAEILASQRKERKQTDDIVSPKKSDSDSDVVRSLDSSSSLDCKSLEISDNDPELQEMLKAQKSIGKGAVAGAMVTEIAADNNTDDDPEFQAIMKAQKSAIDELQLKNVEFQKPMSHSSPLVNMESKIAEDSKDKSNLKRIDNPKGEKSPASKKFKRRNSEMYVVDSSGEDL